MGPRLKLLSSLRSTAWIWFLFLLSASVSVRADSAACLLLTNVDPMTSPSNWVAISSFSMGVVGNGTNATFQELSFSKAMDANSGALFEALRTNATYSKVLILTTNVSGAPGMTYWIEVRKAQVTRVSTSALSDGTGYDTASFQFQGPVIWGYSQLDANSQALTFGALWNLLSNTGASISPFTVTGTQSLYPPVASLTWPATNGVAYRIQGAPRVNGPYTTLQTVTASATGSMTVALTNPGGNSFFRVNAWFP